MSTDTPSFSLNKHPRPHHIAIITAMFNEQYTSQMSQRATQTLQEYGVGAANISHIQVPGSFEIPYAVQNALATKRYNAIITLGVIIRGETTHYDLVSEQSAAGIMHLTLTSQIPIIFGILSCENEQQVRDRISLAEDYSKGCLLMIENSYTPS